MDELPTSGVVLLPRWAAALVVVAGVLAFGNGIGGQFYFDDHNTIIDNPAMHRVSLAEVAEHPGRMLVDLTFQANYQWGGEKPLGYHLVNIAIHLAAGLVLLDLVRRTLLLPGIAAGLARHSTGLALAVALLWTVHPLQTQAVTYVVQRYESLMGLLYLLTIYCVLRGSEVGLPGQAGSLSYSARWYVAAFAAAWGAAACKEVALTLPVVLLAYDWAFLAGPPSLARRVSVVTIWRERAWLYLALLVPMTWVILGVAPMLFSGEASTVGFQVPGITAWEYLRSQPAVLLEYLRLSFWPDELVLDRGWQVETAAWRIYGLGAVILLLLGLSVWALWRHPRVGAIGLAFFVILAPTSSIVPIQDLAYEHRMYLPLAAVGILTVLGGWSLIERFVGDETRRRHIALACVATATLFLGVRTHLRNRDYCDPLTFWSKIVAHAPHHARPYKPLAWLVKEAGRTEEAKTLYAKHLELDPNSYKCWVEYGNIFFDERDYPAALAQYKRAVQAHPPSYIGWLNVGRTKMLLADFAGAAAATEQALPLAEGDTRAAKQLAWLLATAPDDAVRNGPKAVAIAAAIPRAISPIDIQLLEVLAAAHAEAGQFDEAVRWSEEAHAAAESIASPRQQELAARVELYRSGRPFRFSPPIAKQLTATTKLQ